MNTEKDLKQPLKTIVLQKIGTATFDKCVRYLSYNFRTQELNDMVQPIKKWLNNKKVLETQGSQELNSCLRVMSFLILKKHTKMDNLEFLATFFAHPYNCRLLFENTFSDFEKFLLEKCLDNFYVSIEELLLNKTFGHLISTKNVYRDLTFNIESPWFSVVYSSYSSTASTAFVTFNPTLFSYFYPIFHPKPEFNPLCDVKGLRTMKTEEDVIKSYPIVESLFKEGNLSAGANGKMLTSVIKECAQQTNLLEFFPDSKTNAAQKLRTNLFFPFVYHRMRQTMLKSSKKKTAFEELMRDNYYQLLPDCNIFLPIILPHIAGGNYRSLDTNQTSHLIGDIWIELVYRSKYQWISVNEIIDAILCTQEGYQHLHLFSQNDYRYKSIKLKNSKTKQENLPWSHLRKEVFEPCVKGILLMLASAGFMDIAFREEEESDTSYVDRLQYVHITNLGAYCMLISKTYTPEFEVKQEIAYELDPEWLIIRSNVNNPPFLGFLNEISRPIGNHRYIVTEKSFLRTCDSPQELERKIEQFNIHIAEPTTDNWKNFFASLQEHCSPFQTLTKSHFNIYEINPEKKELIQLINTDPMLRQCVIRAEGFIFLVRKENMETFAKRLKELGYIM